MEYKNPRLKLGPVQQKILLLLMAGVGLGLSASPSRYFYIIRSTRREWNRINQRSLHEAIKKLYQSKLISYKENNENNDDTITLTLTEKGKVYSLRYNLETMKLKREAKWDRLWRIVLFDIPENLKKGRDALARKLKQLGFYRLQKSIFIYPYECKDEINFLIEIFDLRPYVRIIIAKEIDIDLELKHLFKLRS